MTISIFNISKWQANTSYKKNDIVKEGDFFYYAVNDFTSGGSFDISNWIGTDTDNITGKTIPSFEWRPTYPARSQHRPDVPTIQFGDSYVQRSQKNINNDLLVLNLEFRGRDQAEAAAILHFFHARRGVEAFLFVPWIPFKSQKRFICREWDSAEEFYDNINITARFEEVVFL